MARAESRRHYVWFLYILVVAATLFVLVLRFNHYKIQAIQVRLDKQAKQIEQLFNHNIFYIQDVLHHMAEEIMQVQNHNYIEFKLKNFAKDKRLKEFLEEELITWYDSDNNKVVHARTDQSLQLGKVENLSVVKEKLYLGNVVIDDTARRYFIPAFLRVNKKDDAREGIITVGIDIDKLTMHLKQGLFLSDTRIALLDYQLKPILAVTRGVSSINSDKKVDSWLKEISSSAYFDKKLGHYFHKMSNYPYVVFLKGGGGISFGEGAVILLDNVYELFFIIFIAGGVLVIVRGKQQDRPSISLAYFNFAILITLLAAVLLVWALASYYFHHMNEDKYSYGLAAEKTVNILNEQFTYVSNLAHFLGEKILQLEQRDAYEIAKLLAANFGQSRGRQEVFSWSLFDFVDSEGKAVASGAKGVLPSPIAVLNRSYMEDSIEKPWTLHLSAPDRGIISGEFVIPVGFGLTDENNKHIGVLSMGFNVNRLVQKIKEAIGVKDISFIMFSKDYRIMLKSSGEFDSTEENFFREKINYLNELPEDAGLLLEPIEYGDTVYSYFKNAYKYPYIILVGKSKYYIESEFYNQVFPKFVELMAFLLFALLMLLLLFFRRKIIKPLIGLSDAAKRISDGDLEAEIPYIDDSMAGHVETSHLAKSILKVKEMLKKEKLLHQELKKAKKSAEKANMAKTDFLSATAHELRTPLNAVINMSDVIRRQSFGSSKKKYIEYANDIYTASTEMLEFISDLLDINQAQIGSFKLGEQSRIDVASIINRSVRLNLSRANKLGIMINTDIAPELPDLFCDIRRVKQVLVNIISNSVKYSAKNTVITVSAYMDNDKLCIKVIDQGMGIDKEQLQNIRKQKYIVKDKPKTLDSFGLGIPIVQHLLKLHGAKFAIDSVKGRGTIVTVIFSRKRLSYRPIQQ